MVLGGYCPFRGEGEECLERIRYGKFTFHQKFWTHVSHDAKQLIVQMLTVDVSSRITAAEALDSNWIRSCPDERKKKRTGKSNSVKKKKSSKSTVQD
jgi:serine/threonine protein kinase